MKVIFLDVDGVLNSNDYVDYTLKNNVEGILDEIDPKTIEMLKYALDVTGAQIVVSSSWRNIRKCEQLKELFLRYGISLGEKTPVLGHERGLEIKQYLKEHADIDQYLILDDDMFDSFDEELRKNLILTKEDQEDHSYGDGLQMKHIEQIIKRFGRVKKKEHDKNKNETFYRCLGGGIEFLEKSQDALKREFKEELGIDISVGDFLGISENIFTYNGKNAHELILFYNADISDIDYKERYHVIDDNSETDAMWVDIDKFKNRELKIYPEEIFEYLK